MQNMRQPASPHAKANVVRLAPTAHRRLGQAQLVSEVFQHPVAKRLSRNKAIIQHLQEASILSQLLFKKAKWSACPIYSRECCGMVSKSSNEQSDHNLFSATASISHTSAYAHGVSQLHDMAVQSGCANYLRCKDGQHAPLAHAADVTAVYDRNLPCGG